MGGWLLLNKTSLHAICSRPGAVSHGGCAPSRRCASPSCARDVFCSPTGAEIIAAAARTDAAVGAFCAPLSRTSAFIFRASLTLQKEGGERRLEEEEPPKVPLGRCGWRCCGPSPPFVDGSLIQTLAAALRRLWCETRRRARVLAQMIGRSCVPALKSAIR